MTSITTLQFQQLGRGRPLLFIHGLGSNSNCWYNQVKTFSATHNIITVDLFGHGKNKNVPDNTSISSTADQIEYYLKKNNKQQVTVVGHGLGGLIALTTAYYNPDLFHSLVVVDTPTKQVRLPLLQSLTTSLFLKSLKQNFKEVVTAHSRKMSIDSDIVKKITSTALETSPQAYYKYMQDILKTNLAKTLGKVDIKTLIVLSSTFTPDKSKVIKTIKKYGYNRMKQKLVTYFPDAGHFIMQENPVEFNSILKGFIS